MAKASEMLMKRDEEGPRATDELTGAGSAGLTKKLRIEYGKYNTEAQANGEASKPWAEWLAPDYALDNRGLVYKVK